MAAGRDVDVTGAESAHERFLGPEEVVFLMVRGRSSPVGLLGAPEEVFGRNELRFRPLRFRPIDYLGTTCLHSGKPVDDPADMVLCVKRQAVVAVLRESCFKRWFVLQDKAALGSYRFAQLEERRAVASDGVTRLRVEGESEPRDAVSFDALAELEYADIVEPSAEAEPAYVRGKAQTTAQGAQGGGSPDDRNIVFCPRCDHPNEIAFLEMTAQPHGCARCQGRFGVRVVEL